MLATKCYVYDGVSLGSGEYSFKLYFDDGGLARFIRQNDIVQDSKGDKYKILNWIGFPANYENNQIITAHYLTNDILPTEDIGPNSIVYTEGELDIRTPLITSGVCSNINTFSYANFEFSGIFVWDNNLEQLKSEIGDYISDINGKLYKIKDFGSPRWTNAIVEEVDKEGKQPGAGGAFLFRPTENFDLYFGGKLNDAQLMSLMNRDNFLIDHYASIGGKGGSGIFVLDVVPTSTGIISGKEYEEGTVPVDINLTRAKSDTNSIRVVVGMNGDGDSYSPTATINGTSVVLSETTTKRWFVGYADINIIPGDNYVLAEASTGSTDSCWVELMGRGPNVLSATFGAYPNDQTELKDGDVVSISITTEAEANEVTILAAGASKYTVILPVSGGVASGNVTASGLSGSQTVTLVAKNDFGTAGDNFTTSALNLNQTHPTLSAISFTYPVGQEAFGADQAGTLSMTASNFDTIEYTSSHFTIDDPTVYNTTKNITNAHTGYVHSGTNVTVTAIRTANGAVSTQTGLGVIATIAPTAAISIVGNPTRLMSSVTGNDYTVVITPNQILASAPDLDASVGTWQGSWALVSNTWRRDLRITDDDPRGAGFFSNLEVTGKSNLVGNNITAGENYTVGGFINRNVTFPAFQRGAFIGTNVVDQTKTTAQVVGGNVLTRYEDADVRQNGYYIGDSSYNYNATGSYVCLSDSAFAGANTTGELQVSIQEEA